MIWRRDLDRVDGFDADYSGWGKEDSDIIARLLHAGGRRKDGTFGTRVRAQRGLSSLRPGTAAAPPRVDA